MCEDNEGFLRRADNVKPMLELTDELQRALTRVNNGDYLARFPGGQAYQKELCYLISRTTKFRETVADFYAKSN